MKVSTKIFRIDISYTFLFLTASLFFLLVLLIENIKITEEHTHEEYSTNNSNQSSSGKYLSIDVNENELDEAIRLAPLAVNVVYEENPVDMQRLALIQSWSTILISSHSAPEQPAYALFATLKNKDENMIVKDKNNDTVRKKKEVILVVRGTASIQDIVTDIRAAPQKFPCSNDEILRALKPTANNSLNPCNGHNAFEEYLKKKNSKEHSQDISSDRDGWLLVNKDIDLKGEEDNEEESYACGGMARAALWLLSEIGPALLQLHKEDFDIIFIGHSMGGSVAALLCHLMRVYLTISTDQPILPTAPSQSTSTSNSLLRSQKKFSLDTFRCVTYGCPSSMCARLAEKMNGYVTSVVLHDDVISRITPQSIRYGCFVYIFFYSILFYSILFYSILFFSFFLSLLLRCLEVMLCYVMLCHIMLCYVTLYYVMSHYVM